jgi:hypothetical protein
MACRCLGRRIFLEDELPPAARQFVVFFQSLLFAVCVNGDVSGFVVAQAMLFLDQCVGLGVGVFILLAHRQQRHRVVAAGRRPVSIHAAAFGVHELAGRAVFHRAQFHAGDAVLVHLVGQGVFQQKFAEGYSQVLFEAQDVVWCQRDVDVAATGVPAGNAFVALELYRLVAISHFGDHRAAGEGQVCCHVSVSHLNLMLITSGVMAGVFPDQQRH